MVKMVSPSGREVEAVSVDFEAKSEPWSTIELEDGSVIKLRTIVTGIVRLEGEFDPTGAPVYSVTQNTILRVVKSKLRGHPTIVPGKGPPMPTTGGPGPEVR